MQKLRQPLPKRSRVSVVSSSSLQAINNKQKLRFLRSYGINVNVDGSWGPWLEQLYRRLAQNKKANVGVLTLPLAGSAVGTGVGAGALPAAIMSAPIALIGASFGQATSDVVNGVDRRFHVPESVRLQLIYSPVSTAVRRDNMELVLPTADGWRPPLTYPENTAIGSRTTTGTVPTDTATVIPGTATGIATRDSTGTASRDTTSNNGTPPENPEQNPKPKSILLKIIDVFKKIGKRNKTGENSTETNTPTNTESSKRGTLSKILWETKKNHFTPFYKWANAGRVVGYGYTLPGVVGAATGVVEKGIPVYIDHSRKLFNTYKQAVTGDTTTVNTPPPVKQGEVKKDTLVISNTDPTVYEENKTGIPNSKYYEELINSVQ